MNCFDLLVNDELIDCMNIDIKDLSYCMSDANDIYIRGKISANAGYKDMNKVHLIVKGDILDKEGNILFTIKDWTSKIISSSHYDLFDLSCCAIHRFLNIHAISAIRVYPVLNTI